jgi:ribosomal-protein-alanine N-acetyltransferase
VSPTLAPLRWWHLPHVLRLESELFGDEQWSPEAFWAELAFCRPTLLGGSPRAYWAAFGADGSELLGYAGLAVTGDEAYVQTLGVARAAQRCGVGRQLLRRLLDDARAEAAEVCWLEVRADNSPAQALYDTFGFRPRGRRRGYYQPSGTDAIVMSAKLGPAREQP